MTGFLIETDIKLNEITTNVVFLTEITTNAAFNKRKEKHFMVSSTENDVDGKVDLQDREISEHHELMFKDLC